MKDPEAYIESGILEAYALGELHGDQAREVEKNAAENPQIMEAFLDAQESHEMVMLLLAEVPGKNAHGNFLKALDQLEAEAAKDETAPTLHPHSKAEDYAPWLKLPEMVAPETYEDPFYIPIAHNEEGFIAVVWVNKMVPDEVHFDAIEKFLVLEGSCTIRINQTDHFLEPGDYLNIPMHLPHLVTVTSEKTCKLIVQRIAA